MELSADYEHEHTALKIQTAESQTELEQVLNYFQLPNKIFLLSPNVLDIYSYLLRCENRNAF